jgi:hypothetical protein
MGHSYLGPAPKKASKRPEGTRRKETIITITVTHEDGKTEEERDSEVELAMAHVNQLIGQGYTSGYDFNLRWEMNADGAGRPDNADMPAREACGV